MTATTNAPHNVPAWNTRTKKHGILRVHKWTYFELSGTHRKITSTKQVYISNIVSDHTHLDARTCFPSTIGINWGGGDIRQHTYQRPSHPRLKNDQAQIALKTIGRPSSLISKNNTKVENKQLPTLRFPLKTSCPNAAQIKTCLHVVPTPTT